MTVITHGEDTYTGKLVGQNDRYYMLDMKDGTRRLLSKSGVTRVQEVHTNVATVYAR